MRPDRGRGRGRARARAVVLASLVASVAACSRRDTPAPPSPPTPASAAAAAAAAASASAAGPAGVDARPAWDALVKRMAQVRDVVGPFHAKKKTVAPCPKTTGAPAIVLDDDLVGIVASGKRRSSLFHPGRASAPFDTLASVAFLTEDKGDAFFRDMPSKPDAAARALAEIAKRPVTIVIDAEETRPVAGAGQTYTPGTGHGEAFVLDAKGAVCGVPWKHTQSGNVGAIAVADRDYDRGVVEAVTDALAPLGWTDVLAPPAASAR